MQAAIWFDRTPRRPGVVHGWDRLGEVAVERAARSVVVRRPDRAARRRLRPRGADGSDPRPRRHRALSGADRVPPRSEARASSATRWKLPRLRHCVSAGEPLNPEVIERWQRGVRPDDPRRLRPDRELAARRQLPGHRGAPRLDGQADARATTSRVIDDDGNDLRARAKWATSRCAATPPTLFAGYYKNDGRDARVAPRRLVPHRRPRAASTTTATSGSSAAPTT